jgi:diguanylate cyclase (GGDEF)-like protein
MKDEQSVSGELLYQSTGVSEPVAVGELLEAIDRLLPDSFLERPRSPEEASQKVFDKTAFLDRMLGDTELAREVAGLFLSHHQELLSALRQAVQRKDCQGLLTATQALKGPIGTLAASRVLEHVGQLEGLARKEDLTPVSDLLTRLEDEVGLLTRELAAIWGKSDSGKIIIADDDPISRRLLQATLAKWGHEPVVCMDGAQAILALSSPDAPKVAILDWMMPGLDGIQVCRELRAREKGPYVYVILLTGKDRPDEIIEGLDAGADDYLVKPFEPNELRARLRAGFRCIDLKDDLMGAAEIDTPHAALDRVTGLATRESILVSLKRNIVRAREASELLAVLMIQVGGTEEMEAKHAPRDSDIIIKEIAERLRAAIEPQDQAGRYEADKILLIMTRGDKDGIIKTARIVRSALTSAPVKVGKDSFPVAVSAGGTVISGRQTIAVGSAILAAEAALGSARARGPNHVVFTPIKSAATRETTPEIPQAEAASRVDLQLIIEARGGYLGRVRNLISRGAKVNARDSQGNTALLGAAFFKYPDVVQFLLENGADPRALNNAGDSALTEALRAGDAEIVNLLLGQLTPADVMANSGALYKALFEVSSYGKPELVNALKKYLAGAGLQPSPTAGSSPKGRSTSPR